MLSSSEPLVAIGMPTYNRASHLKKAMDSLLAQTYRNFVILVYDNGSTDGTRAVCEEYMRSDHRVRYARREKNAGQTINFNDALQAIIATGEYFMMAADDDLWDPPFLKLCMDALLADPKAALAYTGHESFFWEDGRVIKRDPRLYFPDEKDLYRRLKQLTLFYSHDNRGIFIYGVWRKSVAGHLENTDAYEADISLSLHGLSRGYFLLATPEALYHKGTLPGSTSTKDMPFGPKKLYRGLNVRLARTKNEFANMAFLMTVPGLSVWQKIKLLFWNLVVVTRLFTRKKV